MRRMMDVFCSVSNRHGLVIKPRTLLRGACAVALGGVLAVPQTFAKDTVEPATSKTTSASTSGETTLPECLEALKLSAPQQLEAKEIVRKYDAKLAMVWKQFGGKYMETVRTEVALLAAVEDNLTELQRTQVRELRRKVAHDERSLQGTTAKPNQATAKPADPVEQAAGTGISLTDEQEAAADRIQQKYVKHLRSLNRDIEGMHTRLVSLEADKLVELEKLLTPEQLAQLRDDRQATTAAPKVNVSGKTSIKID